MRIWILNIWWGAVVKKRAWTTYKKPKITTLQNIGNAIGIYRKRPKNSVKVSDDTSEDVKNIL